MTAVQREMFAVSPSLALARPHPHNPRCFHADDYHREALDCGHGCSVEVLVCRADDGYRADVNYQTRTGGRGGPLFRSMPAYPTLGDARDAAISEVLDELQKRDGTLPCVHGLRSMIGRYT